MSGTGGEMTAEEVEEELDAPNEVIVHDTLKFWVKKGVLKEEKSKDDVVCRYRVMEVYEPTSPKSKPRTSL